jgi:serine/threonine protein kinase
MTIQSTVQGTPEVPGYRVGQCLGRGSSGSVWSAVRSGDQAVVAVKVVPLRTPLEVAQVSRELAVLGRLEVDGLVRLHEVIGLAGEPPAVAIVVDHLGGGSLAAAVGARGHLSVGESVTVLVPVAKALAGLHSVGVVHGDVSPANVLLESSGRPLLSDLGLARLVGETPADAGREALAAVFGTPGFVAPEVLRGAEPTPASDVYAVGALAWFCVTGEPFQHGHGREPRDGIRAGVPDGWRIATEFALSPDPALRPSASELALAYFDSAPCEPLRLVVGADNTSLLTQRLRRHEDPGDVEEDLAPLSPARRSWPWLAVGCLIVAAATGVGVAHPWTAAAPNPPTPPTTTQNADLATNRDSPRRDPRGLMQALAARRALVMMRGRAEELGTLDVAGSAALATDTTLLTDLRSRGQSYRGVALVVRAARTSSFDTRSAVIDAVVDTAAYTVVDAAGATRHAGTTGARMRFTLRWQEQRWKVERVGAG